MASDYEASCVNDPNFAVICGFFEKFGSSCGVGSPGMQKLQDMLENTTEVHPKLVDLHVRLLRKTRKTVHFDKWERAIVKFCHTYSKQDAWEVERFGYKKSNLPVKLRILKNLLESQFDANIKFRSALDQRVAAELRSHPVGYDDHGNAYWYQLDDDINLRIYKENLDDENWQLVASDREGLVGLISKLNGGRDSLDQVTNEDSNSLETSISDLSKTAKQITNSDDEIKDGIDKSSEETTVTDSNMTKMDKKEVEIEHGENVDEVKTDINKGNMIDEQLVTHKTKLQQGKCQETEESEEFQSPDEADDDLENEELKKTEVKIDNEVPAKEENEKSTESASVNIEVDNHNKEASSEGEKQLGDMDEMCDAQDNANLNSDFTKENKLGCIVTTGDQPKDINTETEIPLPLHINEPRMDRPKLLHTKRKRTSDSDDSNDESDLKVSDEIDNEQKKAKLPDDDEDQGDAGISDAIEEGTIFVHGNGSGKDCDAENHVANSELSSDDIIVGEEILEQVQFFVGFGSGAECDAGNPEKDAESSQATEKNSFPCTSKLIVDNDETTVPIGNNSQLNDSGTNSLNNKEESNSAHTSTSNDDIKRVTIGHSNNTDLNILKNQETTPQHSADREIVDFVKEDLTNNVRPSEESWNSELQLGDDKLTGGNIMNTETEHTSRLDQIECSLIEKSNEKICTEVVDFAASNKDASKMQSKENDILELNDAQPESSDSAPKAPMFFFGRPGCLQLNPISPKRSDLPSALSENNFSNEKSDSSEIKSSNAKHKSEIESVSSEVPSNSLSDEMCAPSLNDNKPNGDKIVAMFGKEKVEEESLKLGEYIDQEKVQSDSNKNDITETLNSNQNDMIDLSSVGTKQVSAENTKPLEDGLDEDELLKGAELIDENNLLDEDALLNDEYSTPTVKPITQDCVEKLNDIESKLDNVEIVKEKGDVLIITEENVTLDQNPVRDVNSDTEMLATQSDMNVPILEEENVVVRKEYMEDDKSCNETSTEPNICNATNVISHHSKKEVEFNHENETCISKTLDVKQFDITKDGSNQKCENKVSLITKSNKIVNNESIVLDIDKKPVETFKIKVKTMDFLIAKKEEQIVPLKLPMLKLKPTVELLAPEHLHLTVNQMREHNFLKGSHLSIADDSDLPYTPKKTASLLEQIKQKMARNDNVLMIENKSRLDTFKLFNQCENTSKSKPFHSVLGSNTHELPMDLEDLSADISEGTQSVCEVVLADDSNTQPPVMIPSTKNTTLEVTDDNPLAGDDVALCEETDPLACIDDDVITLSSASVSALTELTITPVPKLTLATVLPELTITPVSKLATKTVPKLAVKTVPKLAVKTVSKLAVKTVPKLTVAPIPKTKVAENICPIKSKSPKKSDTAVLLTTNKRKHRKSEKNESTVESEEISSDEECGGKKIKMKPKRVADIKSRRSKVQQKKVEVSSSEDDVITRKSLRKSTLKPVELKSTTNKKSAGINALDKQSLKSKPGGPKSKNSHEKVLVKESEKNIKFPSAGKFKKVKTLMGLEITPEVIAVKALSESDSNVRQSRRIAQLKIREEAERRKLEEITLEHLKAESQKTKKKGKDDDEEYTSHKKRKRKNKQANSDNETSDEDTAATAEAKPQLILKKKKKDATAKTFDEYKPWKSSSEADSSNEEENEEEIEEIEDHSEEENPVLKSDHEFSPESDLEVDDDSLPLKHARTVKKDGNSEESSSLSCQKCGKQDHPEWILLCDSCDCGYHCSCLKPVLLVIPEGDWYCPPCQKIRLLASLSHNLVEFDKLVKRKENEDLRQKRLAFVGISLENVLPNEDHKNKKEQRDHSHDKSDTEKSSSGTNSESSDESDSDEPIYNMRERRQVGVSYRFNEYDDLINSAIKDEMDVVKGAGNMGRGKDISTIIDAEKEEKKEEARRKAEGELAETSADKDTANESDKPIQGDEAKKKEHNSENEGSLDGKDNKGDSDSEPIVLKKMLQKKKHRKLNSLDISSEDDHVSDEDFKGSTNDSEDEENESVSVDSESDLEVILRRRKGKGPVTRRSTRTRATRFDREFINDSESSGDVPLSKKTRQDWTDFEESSTEDTEDSNNGGWRNKKRIHKKPTSAPKPVTPQTQSKSKKARRKRASELQDLAFRAGGAGRKKKEETQDEDLTETRRTRGRKMNYVEALATDSEEDKRKKKKKPAPKVIESDLGNTQDKTSKADVDNELLKMELGADCKDISLKTKSMSSIKTSPKITPKSLKTPTPRSRKISPKGPIQVVPTKFLIKDLPKVASKDVSKITIPFTSPDPLVPIGSLPKLPIKTGPRIKITPTRNNISRPVKTFIKQQQLMTVMTCAEEPNKIVTPLKLISPPIVEEKQTLNLNKTVPASVLPAKKKQVPIPVIKPATPKPDDEDSIDDVEDEEDDDLEDELEEEEDEESPDNEELDEEEELEEEEEDEGEEIDDEDDENGLEPGEIPMKMGPIEPSDPGQAVNTAEDDEVVASMMEEEEYANKQLQLAAVHIARDKKRKEAEAKKKEKEDRKLERIQKKEEKMQLKELRAKEREEKRIAKQAALAAVVPGEPKKRGRKSKIELLAIANAQAAASAGQHGMNLVEPGQILQSAILNTAHPFPAGVPRGPVVPSPEGSTPPHLGAPYSTIPTDVIPPNMPPGPPIMSPLMPQHGHYIPGMPMRHHMQDTPPKRKGRGRGKKTLAAEAAAGSVHPGHGVHNRLGAGGDMGAGGRLGVAAPPQPFSASQPTPSVITRMLQNPQGSMSSPGHPGAGHSPGPISPSSGAPPIQTPPGFPPGKYYPLPPLGDLTPGQYIHRPRGPHPMYRPPGAMSPLYPAPSSRMGSPGMYHSQHHPLDPSPSGGGPISISQGSRSPSTKGAGTPPPPYNRRFEHHSPRHMMPPYQHGMGHHPLPLSHHPAPTSGSPGQPILPPNTHSVMPSNAPTVLPPNVSPVLPPNAPRPQGYGSYPPGYPYPYEPALVQDPPPPTDAAFDGETTRNYEEESGEFGGLFQSGTLVLKSRSPKN